MGKYGTNFNESEAVLAATVKDTQTVERIVAEMLDGELRGLKEALYEVIGAIDDEQERRRRARRQQG